MAKLTETQRKWKAHIDDAKSAGQTLKDYAREHKLNVQTLYTHSRRLNKAARAPSRSAFVRVASSVDVSGSVRIDLPNGVRMYLSAPVDIAALLTQVARLR